MLATRSADTALPTAVAAVVPDRRPVLPLRLQTSFDACCARNRCGFARGLSLISRTNPLLWLGRFCWPSFDLLQDIKTLPFYGQLRRGPSADLVFGNLGICREALYLVGS